MFSGIRQYTAKDSGHLHCLGCLLLPFPSCAPLSEVPAQCSSPTELRRQRADFYRRRCQNLLERIPENLWPKAGLHMLRARVPRFSRE